jgi:Ras-related protein Rab-1A
VVFDVTNKDSFINVGNWMNEITKYASDNVNKLLIGNKTDLADRRVVSYEEAKELADSLGVQYIETSAKTATGVEESFTKMTASIKGKIVANTATGTTAQNVSGQKLSGGRAVQGKKEQGGCC